jgi:hypothetical protein
MPRRLVSTVAPTGTIAQRRFASDTSGLSIQPASNMRRARASMFAYAIGLSSSGRPSASATAWKVRSSGVGPIPPQTATLEMFGSSIARRIAAMIASGWSPTTSMWATGRPAANARRASRLELVSWVWPLRISSPTITIVVRPVAFGTGSA